MRHIAGFLLTVGWLSACGDNRATTGDASQADASRPDASRPDASPPDASRPDASRPDAGLLPDATNVPVCDVLTQTGCAVGQKCTWIRTSTGVMDTEQMGQAGCVPAGTVPVDGACVYGASGLMTGYDDCAAGEICHASPATEMATGACQSICSLTDATAPCGAGYACDSYYKFFANFDTDSFLAGMCDATCDPLSQVRDFDDAPACGTTDVALPRGCYGAPSQTVQPTHFTCTSAGTGGHRSIVSPPIFLNSCAPGNIPLLRESTGSTQVVCIAFCKPLPTNTLNPTNGSGMSPYSCPEVGAPNPDEICQHLWFWEGTATPINPASNAYGFCVDFSKYRWDNDMDPGTPDVPWTKCSLTIPYADPMNILPTEDLFWGCVPYPSTLTGKSHIHRASDLGASLTPILSAEEMRRIIGGRH